MLTVCLVPTTRSRARVRFDNALSHPVWLDAAAVPLFGCLPDPDTFRLEPVFALVAPPMPRPQLGSGLVCLASGGSVLSDEVAFAALFALPPYVSYRVSYAWAHPLDGPARPPVQLTSSPVVFESE